MKIFLRKAQRRILVKEVGELEKIRGKVIKAVTSAVNEADHANDIEYPYTFKFLKFLFLNILK